MPRSPQDKAWHSARDKYRRREEKFNDFLKEHLTQEQEDMLTTLLSDMILSRDALLKATNDYPDAA